VHDFCLGTRVYVDRASCNAREEYTVESRPRFSPLNTKIRYDNLQCGSSTIHEIYGYSVWQLRALITCGLHTADMLLAHVYLPRRMTKDYKPHDWCTKKSMPKQYAEAINQGVT
jgi:hypothetical protein